MKRDTERLVIARAARVAKAEHNAAMRGTGMSGKTPWIVEVTGDGFFHLSSRPNGAGDIATFWSGSGDPRKHALLASLAPEMIAALEALCDAYDRDVYPSGLSEEVATARRLLARARGEG